MCKGLIDESWRGGFKLMSPAAGPAPKTLGHSNELREKVWSHTLQVLGRTAAASD
jgi:hypothetical protein